MAIQVWCGIVKEKFCQSMIVGDSQLRKTWSRTPRVDFRSESPSKSPSRMFWCRAEMDSNMALSRSQPERRRR